MPEFLIEYVCPECGHEWHEVWFCACDSECPKCKCGDIQASDYEELSTSAEEAAF